MIKLYSVHALMKRTRFEGQFEVGGSRYRFVYSPRNARLSGSRLRLEGRLSITGPARRERVVDGVHATLLSSQGGLGAPPPNLGALRREITQRLETTRPESAAQQMSATDNTGPTAFAGVLYFQLAPLDARSFQVAADLGRLQMNARLYPVDEIERSLQGVYSALVEVLMSERAEAAKAAPLIAELNRLLDG
jgi:hypothetical protein